MRPDDCVVEKRVGKVEARVWQFLSDHPAWKPIPQPREAEVIGEDIVRSARKVAAVSKTTSDELTRPRDPGGKYEAGAD